jgi:hypothetical protein
VFWPADLAVLLDQLKKHAHGPDVPSAGIIEASVLSTLLLAIVVVWG